MVPLTDKGKKILGSMKNQYGSEKGESVFYASANKGVITGIEKRKHAFKGGLIKGLPKLAKKL
jgi:hypothetical protein